jgi:hypothetical protein
MGFEHHETLKVGDVTTSNCSTGLEMELEARWPKGFWQRLFGW